MKQHMKKIFLCLLALFAGAVTAEAAQFTATVTADNYYAIYVGNPRSLTFVGSYADENFQTVETYTFTVNPGDYIYVAAWNGGSGPKAWLGQFISDTQTILSNTADWEVCLTNNYSAIAGSVEQQDGSYPSVATVKGDLASAAWIPVAYAKNQSLSNVWELMNGGYIEGIDSDALWIWGSNMSEYDNYRDYQIFRAVIPKTRSVTMTFEGLTSWEIINEYYNGGYGIDYYDRDTLKSGPGPNYGVSFIGAYAAIDADEGGDGNFGGEPSPSTAMWCQQSGAWMNVPGGFTCLSFYYSNPNSATKVYVYSGINKTGTLLATIDLPKTEYAGALDPTGNLGPFHQISVNFNGVARCFDFSEEAHSAYLDDITIQIPVESDDSADSETSGDSENADDTGTSTGADTDTNTGTGTSTDTDSTQCFIGMMSPAGNTMPLWSTLLCLAGAFLACRRRQ